MAYIEECDDFRENLESVYRPVQMPGGWQFDHVDTLKTIDLYINSQFKNGKYDSHGRRRYFYNIVNQAIEIAIKFCDLDTKDIILVSEKASADEKIHIMRRDLKQWLKDTHFDVLLNDMVESYATYGHVVIRKNAEGKWKLVYIPSIRTDNSAQWLKDSHFVYEKMGMNRRGITDMRGKWDSDAIDELLASTDAKKFTVYDCFELTDEDDEEANGKRYCRCIRAEAEEDETKVQDAKSRNQQGDDEPEAFELFCEYLDDIPYREVKLKDVDGRWLGKGFGEVLIDNQVQRNEVVNMEARALLLSSLKLLQTTDEIAKRNLMDDVENGDILQVTSQLQPIPLEERNLPAYNAVKEDWDMNSKSLSFSQDIASGGDLPSGTPLGVAQIQAGMVASFFERKREILGIFLRHLFLEDILPSFKKESRDKHLVKFFGSDDEVRRFQRIAVRARVNRSILDHVIKNHVIPDQQEIDAIRQQVEAKYKDSKSLYLEVPALFYEDVESSVDILITGEQIDVRTVMQTLGTALQMVGSNPAIVLDPRLRTVFFKMLELSGVSPVELGFLDQELSAMQPNQQQQQPPGQPGAPQDPMAAMMAQMQQMQQGGAPQGGTSMPRPPSPGNAPMSMPSTAGAQSL